MLHRVHALSLARFARLVLALALTLVLAPPPQAAAGPPLAPRGVIAAAAPAVHALANSPPVIVSLNVEQPNGCEAVLAYSLEVDDPDGDEVTWNLEFSTGDSIEGSTDQAGGTYVLPAMTPHTTVTATLRAHDLFGGSTSQQKVVTVNYRPWVEELSLQQVAAPTTTIQYDASLVDHNGTSNLDWLLSFSDGGVVSGTMSGNLVSGTYYPTDANACGLLIGTLTITDTAGCTAMAVAGMQVNSKPVIESCSLIQYGCGRLTYYQATLSDCNGEELSWRLSYSTGMVTTGSGNTVSSYYSFPSSLTGALSAALVVSDTLGQVTSHTNVIDVNATPTIGKVTIGQPQPGLIDGTPVLTYTATFADGDNDPLSWQLAFDDGGTISGSGATNSISGTYSLQAPNYCQPIAATLTISDPVGCTATKTSNTIDVIGPAQITQLTLRQPHPRASAVEWDAHINDCGGDWVDWRLEFTDGGVLSDRTTAPSISGLHMPADTLGCVPIQATMTITDSAGYTHTLASNVLDMNRPPRIEVFAISQPDSCSSAITYTAQISDCNGTSDLSWWLDFSDGGVVTGTGGTVNGAYTPQGLVCHAFWATLTVSDTLGWIAVEGAGPIDIDLPPQISGFTIAQPDPCANVITYTAQISDCDAPAASGGGTSPPSWQIVFSDGGQVSGAGGPLSGTYVPRDPFASGEITATLTVTDTGACHVTRTSNVVDINQPPQILALALDHPDPSLPSVGYTATITDADMDVLAWELRFSGGGVVSGSGAGSISGEHPLGSAACGPISATLRVTDSVGCVDTRTTTLVPDAKLQVNMADVQDPLPAGWHVRYHVTVRNLSTVAASRVLISDTLPAGVYFLPIEANAGWKESGNVLSREILSLPPGGQVRLELTLGTFTYTRGNITNHLRAGWGCTQVEATETTTITEPPTPTPGHTSTPTRTATPTQTPEGTTTGQIEALVWHDRNRNGRRDEGETPLGGALLQLLAAGGGARAGSTEPVATCITDGDGACTLSAAPGSYRLCLRCPGTFFPTTAGEQTLDLAAGETVRVEFGAGQHVVWLPVIVR